MSNKSAEYPEGSLDKNTLMSFFGVTGDNDDLVHTPGTEQMDPDNWYERALEDPYTITALGLME